jgi:nitroreductase
MELFDAINGRRSVRKFTGEPAGRELLEKVVQAGIDAPSGGNLQAKQYVVIDDPEMVDRIRFVSPAMAGAAAAIVLLTEEKDTKYGTYWVQDASAAMENMLLAAVGLGLAGCWIEGHVRPNEQRLREILGVPEHLRVWSITPVGKPAVEAKRPPKPSLAEVTHYNVYGSGKNASGL